jgi:hypothetical protein
LPDNERDKSEVEAVTEGTVFGNAPGLRNLTREQADLANGDPGNHPGAFKIRLAHSRASKDLASSLIERRYAWRGYEVPQLPADPNLRTFVAYVEGSLVGTLSLRVDSENGLSADDLYKEELSRFRNQGVGLCEFTRLAVDSGANSKAVLGGLMHTAIMYGHRVRDRPRGVIEVNPRHADFYRRVLGFETIGPEKMNQTVQAPSVLLCVLFDRLAIEVDKYFSDPDSIRSRRSFFAHWFPPNEAAGVLNRLRRLES